MNQKGSNRQEPGELYVVATPIGNLKDVTYRAVEALREVDEIVAEDSRHSRRLLEEYEVETPFTISYYQGAGEERRERIIDKLLGGTDLALVSDAGTPLISDPGFKLVRRVRKKDIKVKSLPGPSACIACLSISGQPTDSFVFDGQAPKKESQKNDYFEKLQTRRKTTVIYDSPHRVETTLKTMGDVIPERSITLCRELTKQYERTLKGKPDEVLEKLEEGKVKGEFTLVIGGATEEEVASARREKYEDIPIEQQYEGIKKLKGLSRKEAMRELADLRGTSKNEIYDELNR
jgi:16S rRNA (cytidine1402-2'-O)-methyltransferase